MMCICLYCSSCFSRKYRYTAYRQLVRWKWGIFGRHIRIPLPSYGVNLIRNTFESEDGEHCGFNVRNV